MLLIVFSDIIAKSGDVALNWTLGLKIEILSLRETEGTNQQRPANQVKWIMIGFASLAKELEQEWRYRQAVFLIPLLA